MKRFFLLTLILVGLGILSSSCQRELKPTADKEIQKQNEQMNLEASREVGMPAITNFKEKKTLKWIYELCDNTDLICYAYLFNEREGKIGQFLGKCAGYGVPYSAQFSSPQKLVDVTNYGIHSVSSNDSAVIPQAEPNGIFKPVTSSAT